MPYCSQPPGGVGCILTEDCGFGEIFTAGDDNLTFTTPQNKNQLNCVSHHPRVSVLSLWQSLLPDWLRYVPPDAALFCPPGVLTEAANEGLFSENTWIPQFITHHRRTGHR